MEDSYHCYGQYCTIPFCIRLILELEKTIFFDASPSETLVCTNRYAIATVPLNSVSEKQKVVFCESVASSDGYGAGRGIELSELQRMITAAMKMSKEVIEAGNNQIEQIQE